MKLLHPEVDAMPGRPGQRPQTAPVREDQPLPGSAVIRLTNSTTQENAYTVRLRCEQPFWQDSWYTLVALPPGGGPENAPPPGKRDERGPQDRWVKVYVPRSGSRDILIRFNVPARPDSRAGKYSYTIEVETQVVGTAGDNARRRDRVTRVPAVAIVRPYYKWSVDLTPEERRVGRRNRSTEFEVVVTNEGNDWLYCDLHMPRPKDMTVECPTVRLAVPPPEPDELLPAAPGATEARPGTQRTVPLTAVTRLKTIRGDLTRQPIPVSAQRVDAPSVPPAVADGYSGMGNVVASPTTENQTSSTDRALVYSPPIPAKLTDFFSKSAGSVRTLVFTAIGFVMAFSLGILMYQYYFFEGIKVEPMVSDVKPGAPLLVGGNFLQGSRLYMGNKDGWIKVDYRPDLTRPNRMTITSVPKELDHKQVKLKAQRFVAILPFLSPLLPGYESKSVIQVGGTVEVAVPMVEDVDPGPYKPGATFTISGKNLGTKGNVLINDLKAKSTWGPDGISVIIPPNEQAGAQLAVVVKPSGAPAPLPAGSIQIAPAQVAVGGGKPAGGGGKPAGGGGGGGGKPAGGGGKPAGGGGAKVAGGSGGGTPAGGGGGGGGTPAGGGGGGKPAGGGGGGKIAHGGGGSRPVGGGGGGKVAHGGGGKTVVYSPVSPYDAVLAASWDKAINAASANISKQSNDVESIALEAYAMIKTGKAEQASGLVARAVLMTKNKPGRAAALALTAQGALAASTGNQTAAVQAFQLATSNDNCPALTYIALAELMHSVHNDKVAKEALDEAKKHAMTPQEKEAVSSLAASLSSA